MAEEMKMRVARSIKWNVIDKVATQILYAVTGIVLARMLSQEEFGLVGAVLVFQAFASLFVDSGFSSALIQRKSPTREDYSTILWFNMAMATGIYLILYACAPLIADLFQGDARLIPLSRVMFLTFIINASAIVQTNRLMKLMDVKMIAVSNSLGLICGAIVGITLAVGGYGAWAIVWQSITLAAVKSLILWVTSHWTPLFKFSWKILKSFFSVGMGVMLSSFLNTLFQNIYSFFIGNRVGLVPLGYYTQADKWSKMGVSSMSQVLTSSFLPALSEVQDDEKRYTNVATRISRFTSYLLFPFIGLLIAVAEPLFHVLFGTKWDPSIALFQLLLLRGIFTVLTGLYSNYILSLGRSKILVGTETLRDVVAIVALIATFPFMALSTPTDPCEGLKILLIGQLIASAVTWIATLVITARLTHRSIGGYIFDCVPYILETIVIMGICYGLSVVIANNILLLSAQIILSLAFYLAFNHIAESAIQRQVLSYILKVKS